MIPEKDVIPMEMSVEEGLKMIISFGMTSPKTIETSPNLKS
jgi:uncharacterized membrane protein